MASFLDLVRGICGVDDDDDYEDEIDFCGMPSEQIVEIAIRRDFLLLQLQALVDAQSLEEAEVALVAMEVECKSDLKLQRFLVRAGTVEIIRGNELLVGKRVEEPTGKMVIASTRSVAARSLMKKLVPYHEQRMQKEREKKQRGNWATGFLSGSE